MNLTDKQRVALEDAIDWLHPLAEVKDIKPGAELQAKELFGVCDVLQSMLNQSSPVWQITEERKEALDLLCGLASDHEFRYAEIENEANRAIELIRAMLNE